MDAYVEVHWAAGSEAYVTPVADELVGIAMLTERQAPFYELLAEQSCSPSGSSGGRCPGPAVRGRCASARPPARSAGCCSWGTPPDTSTR